MRFGSSDNRSDSSLSLCSDGRGFSRNASFRIRFLVATRLASLLVVSLRLFSRSGCCDDEAAVVVVVVTPFKVLAMGKVLAIV